ncbi:MAG: hypothetical protein KAQ99_02870, partial [Candidatus Aureabacteria bacterium]|nr:hypothetical protein [Candidatus Auribacterota bacterium]
VVDAAGSDVITLILADSNGWTVTQEITVTISVEISPTAVNVLKAGSWHSLVLDTVNDTVYCWGYNELGSLATGVVNVPPNSPVPLEVVGLSNVMDVGSSSSPGFHNLVILNDRTLWGWGYNINGELGIGTLSDGEPTPVQVLELSSVIDVAESWLMSLALTSDNKVWTWGWGGYGQFGDGIDEEIYVTTPAQTVALDDVISVAAGRFHCLAIRSDRTLWGWGRNVAGQVGSGPAGNSYELLPVQVLTNVIDASGGGDHTIALKSDGTVWSWGDNEYGELGDGMAPVDQLSPVPVSELTDIISIGAGYMHNLALRSDGTVWAWGRDNRGQLGDDTAFVNQPSPVQVSLLTDIIAIGAGDYHSLALQSDGTVWAWGYNSEGQIGDNSYNTAPVPVPIMTLPLKEGTSEPCIPSNPLPLNGAVDVSTNTTLLWTGGDPDPGDVVTYDVYFGTSDPPELVSSGQSGITYDPGILLGNTTYYWQIVTTDDKAVSTSGPIWSFTTGIAPNTSPVINPAVEDISTLKDTFMTYDLTANETDLEDTDETLTWTISGVNTALFNASIDAVTDVLTITPVADQEGSDVVTLTLTDSGGLTAAQDVTVTIMVAVYPILTVNDTPTLAEITVGGEEDMYQFTVAEAGTYSIETQLVTLADTYIYLYGPDSEMILIKENDDGGEGSASYIFRSLSSGIYYVKVRAYSATETGTYTVQVTGTPAPAPISPTILSGIAGGENHSYVVYEGTVWSWGWNSEGQLGDDGSEQGIYVWSPVSIGFSDAISLASIPWSHSFALKSDGTVWSWGHNGAFELGIEDAG